MSTSLPLSVHFAELRRRLVFCLAFFAVSIIVVLWQDVFFLKIVSYPHRWAALKLHITSAFYVFRYQDNFLSQLKLSLYMGLILSFPFIVFQILMFAWGGLHQTERKRVALFVPLFIGLFFTGVLFGYFILIPWSLRFLMFYGQSLGFVSMVGFSDYLSLFFMLTFLTGFIFELPLVMVVCSHMGLCSSRDFRLKRSYAVFFSFVIGGVLTPPDPWTQIMLALPLIVLYEVGIWSCWMTERRKDKMDYDSSAAEKASLA
ncbi:MAG: twin-arginine translocase subunit TatC [Deltaproteobacteria bacterium]|nr:twin-arginine translocase subunit TatC [Deltaproteobacteria bacterium]